MNRTEYAYVTGRATRIAFEVTDGDVPISIGLEADEDPEGNPSVTAELTLLEARAVRTLLDLAIAEVEGRTPRPAVKTMPGTWQPHRIGDGIGGGITGVVTSSHGTHERKVETTPTCPRCR